jgi:hypothetical protein
MRYIEHGSLNIGNNRAERTTKPFAIGGKNWMFANITSGSKANGIVPFDYIKYWLDELSRKPDDIDYLLSWNDNLT